MNQNLKLRLTYQSIPPQHGRQVIHPKKVKLFQLTMIFLLEPSGHLGDIFLYNDIAFECGFPTIYPHYCES